jgi:hypothetical protein
VALQGCTFCQKTCIFEGLPHRECNFRVDGEILIEGVEDDGLVEQIFRDEEVRALRNSLGFAMGVKL